MSGCHRPVDDNSDLLVDDIALVNERGDLVDIFLCHETQRATMMQQVVGSNRSPDSTLHVCSPREAPGFV